MVMAIRIDLTLPEWVDDRANIRIFAGIELVAQKLPGKGIEIKTKRCNRCGKCCSNVSKKWVHGEKDGNCLHLKYYANEYLCDSGFNRPFACCASDDSEKDFCNIEWEEVN